MDPIKKQIFSAVTISFLGYAGGMVLAYPGVALAQWELEDSGVLLTSLEASWFASIAQLVSIPGCIIGGFLLERIGPKSLTLIFLPLLALTWLVITYVVSKPPLLIFVRAIQGFICSFLSTAAGVYPCEIADVSRRGFLGGFMDVTFSLGFLVMYMIGGVVSWKYFGYIIICITTVPCLIGTLCVPESPLWLIRKGKLTKAIKEMKKIRRTDDNVEKEVILASERISNEKNFTTMQQVALLGKLRYILPVTAVVTLLLLKEATGQFAVVLFVVQIFRKVETGFSSYWSSVIVGATRLIFNLFCCILLSKLPRRFMICYPSIIAAVSMLALGSYFYIQETSGITGYSQMYIPLLCLITFVVCYGIGMGPVSWLLAAELLPSSVRNVGCGIGQAGFNLTQWIVAGSFVKIEETVGLHACFWMYSCGCLCFALFVFSFIPETKGKSLSHIEDYWINVEENWKQITGKKRAHLKENFIPQNQDIPSNSAQDESNDHLIQETINYTQV